MNKIIDIKEKIWDSNKKKYEKLMILSAFIMLVMATVFSINNNNYVTTIIPFRATIVPIINGATAFLCFILLFIKENYRLQSLILFIQGICTAITGYEILGAFLYSAMFVILFVNKFFTTNTKKKLIILVCIWILTIFSLLAISYTRFITVLIISFFFATFYAYIYKKTEDILSVFIPTKKSFDSNNTLPNQGEEIFLKDYNLTERQIILLKDFIENKSTYIKLSKKYNISISTVKKDMAVIFTKFNVANNNELFILLSQFIVR